jgi:hypothetical protein
MNNGKTAQEIAKAIADAYEASAIDTGYDYSLTGTHTGGCFYHSNDPILTKAINAFLATGDESEIQHALDDHGIELA